MATPVTLVTEPGQAPWYPVGATPKAASSGNQANATAAASLAAVASKTNYLAGFSVSGAGATAGAAVSVTVTGVLGGPLSFTYVFASGAAVANQPLGQTFDPPLAASGPNTAITVSCPAGGAGNTNNTTTVWGYDAP